eukprot:gene11880-15993_t
MSLRSAHSLIRLPVHQNPVQLQHLHHACMRAQHRFDLVQPTLPLLALAALAAPAAAEQVVTVKIGYGDVDVTTAEGRAALEARIDARLKKACALPAAAHNQKPTDGRWRCSKAPTAAVASGNTPTITLACMASTWRMATEVSSGKPNTTPPAVMASGSQSARAGQGARVKNNSAADNTAATVARPM